jgi:hypothetical protein
VEQQGTENKDSKKPRRNPVDAFSIASFCERHDLSIATYYRMRAVDKGPAETRLGSHILISREAAERWRKQREADTKAGRGFDLQPKKQPKQSPGHSKPSKRGAAR